MVPQIARAEPVNCLPKGVDHTKLSAGKLDGKIGKITSKSEQDVKIGKKPIAKFCDNLAVIARLATGSARD
jgi:hypothetical protein